MDIDTSFETLLDQSALSSCKDYAQSDVAENTGFANHTVSLTDGSRWKILAPLSKRKYQQVVPPCEATQVFTCVCVEDPRRDYEGISEAVIKVKYQ